MKRHRTISNATARAKQLRADIRAFLATREDLHFSDLARHTSLASSTGRAFMAGHCPGGRMVIGELSRVLELAKAGSLLPPGGEPPKRELALTEEQRRVVRPAVKRRAIYETATMGAVAKALDYCYQNATIGVVTGAFGVGKTEAVRVWRRGAGRGVDTALFEFDVISASNAGEFLKALAELLGVNSAKGAAAFRGIVERLRMHPVLLVFDQCEALSVRVFQAIRQIWDRTAECGVGVVLLAAPILTSRMMASQAIDLGALTSRVGLWVQLDGLTRVEMAAIAKREGVEDIEDAAFETWWRACGGSMRRLMRSIDLLKAAHAGKRITARTIAGVAAHLWGMRLRGDEQ